MKNTIVLLAMLLAGCGKFGGSASAQDKAARQTCTDVIESRATNPKSVSYAGNDPAIVKNAKGQLDVTVKFSAKNEIGMASTMVAKCNVSPDGKTLLAIAVNEIR